MTTVNSEAKTTETLKNTKIGVVDSISGFKTVRVALERLVQHPLYGKFLRRRTRLMVHDEQGQAKLGDTVKVVQCRPMSKTKAWRLVRIVKRAGE